MNRLDCLCAVGLLAAVSLLDARLADAFTMTTLAAVIPQLQGEAQSWLIGGAIMAISVGLLAQGMSRLQNEFVSIFGHIIEWAGRAAFGAAAIAIISLVAPAGGEPVTRLSPPVLLEWVLDTVIHAGLQASVVLFGGVVIYGIRRLTRRPLCTRA